MLKNFSLKKMGLIILTVFGLAFLPAVSTQAACPDDIFAYWNLDETVAGTYADIIKGNIGTGVVNPVPVITGRVSGAQEFNGSSTSISVPADNSFDWKSYESFSIEFWIKTSSAAGGTQVVIGRDVTGPNNLQWWVGLTDSKVSFALRASDGTGSGVDILGAGSDLNDGNWHHIVAVRDDSVGAKANIIYVDGVEQARDTFDYAPAVSFASDTAPITIGSLNASFYYEGQIDEVALYDRALSPADILAHQAAGIAGTNVCSGSAPFVPYPDDTISLWQLDETAAGTYVDAFDGNIGTGVVNPVPVITGRVSGAQEFNGSSTSISVPADNSFDWKSYESFSIEFWIKTSSAAGGTQVVIGRDVTGPNNLQWWVGLTDSKVSFALRASDGTGSGVDILGAGSDLNDGNWHHIVAVRDDSVGAKANIIYVDGVEQARDTFDYAPAVSFASDTAPITIGSLNASFYYEGQIDEVAIYDRVLPPAEIVAHRDAGLQGNGVDSLRPDPVADAGVDQTVQEGDAVTLDGSASSDTDGTIVAWLWEQVGTPAVTLAGAATPTATFTAPSVTTATTLTFQLTVTDNDGLIDTDTVVVTVSDTPTTPPPTTPPTGGGGGGGGGCFINTLF